jgi:hypothetical protein
MVVPVDVSDPGAAPAGGDTKDIRHIERADTSGDGELDRFQQASASPLFLEPCYRDFRMSLFWVPATAASADQHVRKLDPFSLQLSHRQIS